MKIDNKMVEEKITRTLHNMKRKGMSPEKLSIMKEVLCSTYGNALLVDVLYVSRAPFNSKAG